MEIGNWHGYTATVLYKNENNVEFLIGDFNQDELGSIIDGLNNGDEQIWSDYGYSVASASREEWDEQQ